MVGHLVAICRTPAAGQSRVCSDEGELRPDLGLVGDETRCLGAIPGAVILLALELIERAGRQFQLDAGPGAFGEHLTVTGLDTSSLEPGTRLQVGDAMLDVVQIGQPSSFVYLCAYRGISLLPKWGIYCRVAQGGRVAKGDTITPLPE